MRSEVSRREREDAEAAECTFRPAISRRTGAIAAERTAVARAGRLSLHHALYQDSLRRLQRRAAYESWFPEEATFQPRLVAAQHAGGAPGRNKAAGAAGGARAGEPYVVDRLYAKYGQLQAKLADARARLEAVDMRTGEPLYRPKTLRGPTYARSGAVWEQLYEKAMRGTANNNGGGSAEARPQQQSPRQAPAQAPARPRSRASGAAGSSNKELLQQRHRRRFQALFEQLLGRDGAGADAETLDLAALAAADATAALRSLEEEARKDVLVAARLAKERGANGGGRKGRQNQQQQQQQQQQQRPIDPARVDFDAFVALMEEAIAANPRPRVYLTRCTPRPQPEEPFAPKINARSRQIAEKLRAQTRPAAPLHEQLHREAREICARRAQLRALVAAEEMRECTFSPTLVSGQFLSSGIVMREVLGWSFGAAPRGAGGRGGSGGGGGSSDGAAQGAAMERAASAPPRSRGPSYGGAAPAGVGAAESAAAAKKDDDEGPLTTASDLIKPQASSPCQRELDAACDAVAAAAAATAAPVAIKESTFRVDVASQRWSDSTDRGDEPN